MKGASGRAVAIGLACLAISAAAWCLEAPAPEPAPASSTLRLVAQYEVPSAPSVATSVRWASDRSVYVARLHDGVSEVALDANLSPLHVIVPDAKTLHAHFTTFSRLAVSSKYLAASSLLTDFAFRPLGVAAGGAFPVTRLSLGIAYAYDLSGDRLVFVGDPDAGEQRSAGVIWTGSLHPYSRKDLRPLLFDAAATGRPKAPGLINCQMLQLGAARFLADGSFLVIPGFQSGVHLYSSAAQLVRTWQNEDLGFDAPDCAAMSPQEEARYRAWPPARFDFLNQYRVVDEILPLPQGAGLLIRSAANGKVSWVLRLLRPDGTMQTYDLPFTGTAASERLRGDVRGDRIVLLRVGFTTAKALPDPSGTIYLLEMPPGARETAP